tara:strand:- start:368 stop:550 length:183 start_codon:yes stop_codon:yes gene_type:complete
MVEFKRCQFCNNTIDLTETWTHNMCEDWYKFLLDQMVEEAKKRVEMLLLKRKLLLLNKDI